MRLVGAVQERIERSCERLGLSYPWWIPAYSTLATVVLTAVAFGQRGASAWSPAMVGGLVLTLLPVLLWMVSGSLMLPWIEALAVTCGVSLYLTHAVTVDFAPLLFLITAGEVTATMGLRIGTLMAGLDVAILLGANRLHHLVNAPLYVVGVILGADVGFALRWQMRALRAEQANAAIAQEQAVLSERQRLAREVHDVVGHSLSITLLHVTAARHALAQHADINDATESLVEAERVGRSAMGDLRRTVSVLSAGPSAAQPLPGIDDVPALIELSRVAGLDVAYTASGSCTDVGDAAGLGIYRIVQESLANIAKHAPTASAAVMMTSSPQRVHVRVRNTLPAGASGNGASANGALGNGASGGSGLPGMAARAQQMGASLRTGVAGDCWLVELVVPALAAQAGAEAPA
jgi:signal transduction histidine kinase